MTPRFDPRARLEQFPILRVLRERVLVFDGAMGTQIQSANLTLDDFAGQGRVELSRFKHRRVLAGVPLGKFVLSRIQTMWVRRKPGLYWAAV